MTVKAVIVKKFNLFKYYLYFKNKFEVCGHIMSVRRQGKRYKGVEVAGISYLLSVKVSTHFMVSG